MPGPRPRQGWAAYGSTRRLGYHPLLASRADTGELQHLRMRTGSPTPSAGPSGSSTSWPVGSAGPGPPGRRALRGDSGFWSGKVIGACRRHVIRFSITVRQTTSVKAAIAAISDDGWTDIDDPDGGVAQLAETTLAHNLLR